jgi:hypothetical protein
MSAKVLCAQPHPLGKLVKMAAMGDTDHHCMRDVAVSIKEHVMVDEADEARRHVDLSITANMSWYGLQLCVQGTLEVSIWDFERQVRGALPADGLVANDQLVGVFVPTLLRCRW